MADQTFTAHLFGRSKHGDREEVLIKLLNFSEEAGGIPSGGPGVLVREEEDGEPIWAPVEIVDAEDVPVTPTAPLLGTDVQAALDEISDLFSSTKGVVVWDGTGSQPARPGFLSVEFVQDADPAAVVQDGDTWVSED